MPLQRQIILGLDTTNPYHRKIVGGVAAYAHAAANWDLHLVQGPIDKLLYLRQDPLENPPKFRRWRTDGIIASFYNRKIAMIFHGLRIPVVGIEAEYGWGDLSWRIPYFATDNEAIGRLAAEDLIQRGLKHLAFCGVPGGRFTGWSKQRQLAFEQRAREAGLPCSAFIGESLRGGKQALLHKKLLTWLKSLEKPVGLMACYDVRARHVLMACRSLGLLVPEDVAVIGVDNDELMCELTSPPLSSIEQGARTIGYQAATLLDRLMAGEKAPLLKYVVQPDGIVTRRSSDVFAIKDADVAEAMRFIRQNACRGIRVGDVVQTIAISRSALETRFKAAIGRTVHAEIQRVQIERVRQLVTTTDLPLKQVAVEAGFKYSQHLVTTFHRHIGQTPGVYRKRSRM